MPRLKKKQKLITRLSKLAVESRQWKADSAATDRSDGDETNGSNSDGVGCFGETDGRDERDAVDNGSDSSDTGSEFENDEDPEMEGLAENLERAFAAALTAFSKETHSLH